MSPQRGAWIRRLLLFNSPAPPDGIHRLNCAVTGCTCRAVVVVEDGRYTGENLNLGGWSAPKGLGWMCPCHVGLDHQAQA
jgi:hypothetical protein